MSKAQIRSYAFTPGTVPNGKIEVPGKFDLQQLLVITNTTRNVILYNFADATYAGTTVTFNRSNSAAFPTATQNSDGTTTITLAVSTSGQSSSDTIQIFYEKPFTDVRFPSIGTDAFERLRVSAPQSMLDADFEYGLQPTKWQTYSLIRNYPSIYEVPGTDIGVITVTTGWDNSGVGESLMTVNTSTAHGLTVGQPFTIKGYLTTVSGFSRAEGSFIVNSVPTTFSFTYYGKGPVGSATNQVMSTAYTVLRKGGFYTGASIGSPTFSYVNNNVGGTTATVTITFASNHGLLPNDTIAINITSGGTNNNLAQGPFYVESVPTQTTLTYTARAAGSISGTLIGIVYTRPDAFYSHRPFDGGVMLGTGGPSAGALAVRQSKKYIRYQSGKAINYNTGALFAPSYDIRSASASSSLVGATITFVTDNSDHGFQVGCTVNVYGVVTGGYNGTYTVSGIIDERTFTVTATQVLSSTTASLIQDPCQVSLVNWYGATVRAGTFDDQNGQFWAYDGQTAYVGYRFSIFQLAGVISVTTDSNQMTGTSTRFSTQLVAGDKIVIKGMTHVVTSIPSDTLLYFTPDYRGTGSAVTTATGTSTQTTITVASYTGLTLGMNVSGTGIGGGATISSLSTGTTTLALTQVSIATQAGGASLGNSLTLNSVSGVQVGMTITAAAGIPAGTTITSVNNITLGITISQNLTQTLSAANVTIGANALSTASSVSLVVVGSTVISSTGGGVANGTSITSIITGSTNYLIMSANVTGSVGTVTLSSPYVISLSVANSGTVSGTLNFTTTYTGVVVTKTQENIVPQNQWNVDRCDGTSSPTNPSGYNFLQNKMQMIGIQWTWYGAGFIDWMLRGPEGSYITVHRIKASNVNTLAYMRSGNQPVRYEVSNDGVYRAYLTVAATSTDTTFTVASTLGFPSTGGYLWVDGEIVQYTGTTSTTFTGLTRAASLTQFTGGQQRTFTGNPSKSQALNTGIVLYGQTATPIIQHWGSAFLTDGGFDSDRGYLFNYQATNITISTKKTTAFAIRLAPSVSNAIIGDLGIRDLINRAQLLLQTLEITAGGTSNTNSALVIEGVINPQNYPIDPANITWNGLQGNSNTYFSGGQPSFSQIAPGTTVTFANSATNTLITTGAVIGTGTIILGTDPIAQGVQVGDDVFIPSITNAVYGNTKVLSVQSSPSQVTISNPLVAALTNGTQIQFSRNTYAVPGETIFSFISSPQNKDSIDLSALKEMTSTPLGGRGTFPNGPDSLFINVYLTQGNPVLANLVLRWGEAQA